MIREEFHNLKSGDKVKSEVSDSLDKKLYRFFNCCDDELISNVKEIASNITNNFKNIVIVGSGGSINSGITYNSLSDKDITFFDNIDPDQTLFKINTITDPKNTCVIFISKSGKSEEILVLYRLISEHFSKYNITTNDNFFVITQDDKNPLFKLAKDNRHTILNHDPDIGGRFSYLSIVGLLAAEISGLDIAKIRKGAADAIKRYLTTPFAKNAYCKQLASNMLSKKLHANIFMAYNDKLLPFQIWQQQLWAESLGKDNLGSIPVSFSGTRDQHSQLQLYLANPAGKAFNVITCSKFNNTDKNLCEIFNTHAKNVINNLAATGQLLRTLELPELNEYYLGKLMTNMILETLITAEYMQINPFGQGKVEAIKLERLATIQENFTQ